MDPSHNLYAILRAGFADRLDMVFLRTPEDVVTYRDIDEQSGRLAAALGSRGVVPGDRVVVQVAKSANAVALYLACLRAGAVYVPLNEAYTDEEVAYFVEDAQPALVVRGSLDELVTDAAGCEPLGSPADRAGQTAAMLYTSGTTGKPKGAMLTTENLASNARALAGLWGFSADDVLVHALPIFHVHGLFIALHCAMLRGCEVRFLPRFEVSAVRAALRGSTVMMGVPTFYSRLLAEPDFGVDDCRTMRLFISGSAPLTESVHAAFAQRTGHRILERYGMTETGMITSNPLDGDRIAGTVGHPLPDVEIRAVDEHGAACPTGAVGVVEVRGPNVFAGYWRMPDKTASSFRDGGDDSLDWFVTGDLGSVDTYGRLTLAGRGTDLIISGGLNIYPKEIELLLDDVPGVVESAVIGVPHPDLGDGVLAVIVAAADFDPAAIAAALDGRLARFKHPKHVAVVTDLPRNAMGKVEKAALRRAYVDVFS
ncbi:MAG: fatty acid CoA ligase [Acidimicrobiales bacterium]|nr:fatty acid CoA ligase [Acidimicrobiales bacterium]